MKTVCRRDFLLIIVTVVTFTLLHATSRAQEIDAPWPQFRGPGGLGVSAEKGLPVNWSQDNNVVWKKELPGGGVSSPIIIGERIFLTCYSGYNVPGQPNGDMDSLKLHVLCLHRSNGNLLWKKTLAPKLPEQDRIRENHGYASSTPIADSKHVYVFFGKTGVFCFDHEGNQVWHAEVGSSLSGWGSAASPVLYKDLLIVNASVESESLVALDKRTGKEQWRANGIRQAWNTPQLVTAPNGKTELIVPIIRKILAFDPASGEQLWWVDTKISWYMVPSVVAHEGIVYCIGGRSGDALAVRAGGQGEVTQSHIVWRGKRGSNVSSPIYHQGHLYWMHEKLGIAYCADAKTGNLLYEERIPRAGQIYASPVLADGKLYYFSRYGRAFVVAAQPKFELLAVNDIENDRHFNASPAIADSRLFVRSNRYLYCIGSE